jgi:hypothetical protein
MAYGRRIKWNKTVHGMSEALGYAGEHLSGWAKDWMADAVRDSLAQIDADWEGETHWKRPSGKVSSFGGDRNHPWYTGQLHDSVVGIVSDRSRTVSIQYMPQAATKPQTYEGQIIIGHDWGQRKAQELARTLHFVPGIVATIGVGVPYAEEVDEMDNHAGYMTELSTQFASTLEDFFEAKAGGFRTRTFIAEPKKK